MAKTTANKGGFESNDFLPEGKYLKKNWASRDSQRWKRGGLKRHTRQVLNRLKDEYERDAESQDAIGTDFQKAK